MDDTLHCPAMRREACDQWEYWIDTGGTFTDCLARDPRRQIHRAKVLSSSCLRAVMERRESANAIKVSQDWNACDDFVRGFELRRVGDQRVLAAVQRFDAGGSRLELDRAVQLEPGILIELKSSEEAPILAARLASRTPSGQALSSGVMRLGTTRATNALLERQGARTVLFITRGFGDLLHIGDQQRPELFALAIRKLAPLHEASFEVDERLAADGSVIAPLNEAQLREEARRAVAAGFRAAAVAFMHADRHPRHEARAAAILLEEGFEHVTSSHECSRMIRIVPRAQTAVMDAYLTAAVREYLARVRRQLGSSRLMVMTSAGGLIGSEHVRARDMVLSGPAGGVVGAAAAGAMSGFSRVIGFDMGGTSTDVARFDGRHEYAFEHMMAGVRLMSPVLAIETVAAGGGSICECVEGQLRVGPRSAGASPGPACYGAGGPLTVTDVNLLLGRLDASRFEIPLFPQHAERRADELHELWRRQSGFGGSIQSMLEGLLAIADERMADAIRQVSVRRGYEPAEYALVAFGGAGGQHACGVASRLGIRSIVVPADASLLSALGIGKARIERFAERQVLYPLEEVRGRIEEWFAELTRQAVEAVAGEGVNASSIGVSRRLLSLRLKGQDTSLVIEHAPGADAAEDFAVAYETTYGHQPRREARAVEVESMRVVACTTDDEAIGHVENTRRQAASAARMTRAWVAGAWRELAVFDREAMSVGDTAVGPALVADRRTAVFVDAGWRAVIDAAGAIILSGDHAAQIGLEGAARGELFAHRFMSIAQEMGQMLQRTALSTNVKERLDYSCTVLDAQRQLVANAPHMPVHLGSMGLCVRAVMAAMAPRDGDVIVTNHPAWGGSHLPDLTVVTAVFEQGALLGFAASRAHHAELGGSRPGSMPPGATTLIEEGVVIAPVKIIEAGRDHLHRLESLLRGAKFPSRTVEDNLADVRSQIAANACGAQSLRRLARRHGAPALADQMKMLREQSAQAARAVIGRFKHGRYAARQQLDDGSSLNVVIEMLGDRARIDFAGTAPQHPGNLNATPAIVRSAVLYVLRLLMGEHLPLNEGIMEAVALEIPRGMLNPEFPDDPAKCPAVVGGNIETSQRLVDTLLLALGAAACSQGTMNNTLFGNDRFGYYETVCGGSGATEGCAGADAVHTHMTNTRITDPEILEHRYPVRLEQFAIRRGSGGRGRWRGGDGAIRQMLFLEPVSLSMLTQHRVEGPYGMQGGEPGACGRQRVIRADGSAVEMRPIDGCEIRAGDRLVLETPGGGGWGTA